MKGKLTLKESKEVARTFSDKTGISISKMFEEYLDNITSDEQSTSSVKQISGLLKGRVPEDVDWKEMKAEYLKEKYGL